MKKLTAGIAAAAIILTLGTTSAFAAGRCHRQNFYDGNGDGICDSRGSSLCGRQNGCRFTDENGDGICDNYGTETCRRGSETGCRGGYCR